MMNVSININEATVTAVHEFNSYKGYGVDFFIEVRSNYSMLYLQVVMYDDEARRYCNIIHPGDIVTVQGSIKVKKYPKSDGAAGYSLVIEKPHIFRKTNSSTCGSNCNLQSQQFSKESNEITTDSFTQVPNAGSASAGTAEKDYWDDTDFWNDVEENYKKEREKASDQSIDDDPESELPF